MQGMLVGLFIVALGFFLFITNRCVNPFAILLGDPKTGASRVNLGGGINLNGTNRPNSCCTSAFGTAEPITDEQIKLLELSKVVPLYVGVGLLFIAAAALFFLF
jgi:FHS family L-fucose permease-like MFS transporter